MNQPFRIYLRVNKSGHTKGIIVIEQGKDIENLLKGCRKGDRKSQDTLYKQFYGYAMGICRRYSRSHDEAVEILNDGFYKIMTNLDKYTSGLSFKGWMRKVMINAAIDHFRKNEKHYNSLDISYVKNENLLPEVWGHLSEQIILKAVQELPPSYRLVFNLHAIEGYKHEEIAHKLGIGVGTSKSNLNMARIKLMKALSLEYDKKIEQNG